MIRNLIYNIKNILIIQLCLVNGYYLYIEIYSPTLASINKI